jgi:hypothetical protein
MWRIGLISNTVAITDECAKDLFAATGPENPWYEEGDVAWRGKLSFNEDHYEHMDYVNRPAILAVLAQHRVNGDITFGSLEGDNRGAYWGYRFADGVMTKLKGRVVFEPVTAG